jgi:hypothetical protein
MTGETKSGAKRARSYDLGASGLQGPGSAPYSTLLSLLRLVFQHYFEISYFAVVVYEHIMRCLLYFSRVISRIPFSFYEIIHFQNFPHQTTTTISS